MRATFSADAPKFLRVHGCDSPISATCARPAQSLFAEIRKNICGKTCAYFPKYTHVFAEINSKKREKLLHAAHFSIICHIFQHLHLRLSSIAVKDVPKRTLKTLQNLH